MAKKRKKKPAAAPRRAAGSGGGPAPVGAHPVRRPVVTAQVAPLRRVGAYVIDWVLGGIVTGAPAVLLYSAVTRRTDFYSDLYVFEALGYPFRWGVLAGALCILVGLFYYVYVPARLMPGQTVGKRLLGLEVRSMDGSLPSIGALVVRYGVAGFLIEGSAFVTGRFIRELTTLIVRVDVATPWSIAGAAVTVVSGLLALYGPHRRAIHDYLSGTRVVARS